MKSIKLSFLDIVLAVGAFLILGTSVFAQSYSPYYYEIGTPTLSDIYVDPTSGADSNSGATSGTALKSVSAAYQLIPKSSALSTGYRILLMPGTYPASSLPNFWENIVGTYEHPVIVQPAQTRDTVVLTAPINGKNLQYFYLIDLRIQTNPIYDPLHIEQGNHVLLRGLYLDGGRSYIRDDGSIIPGTDIAHETLKVNQSQYVYVENSNIGGADDNAIDFVSVQYGHIVGNKIQRSSDWCMYAKGGSAYLRIEGNEFSYCGTGGFTAGQGTGFEYMTSPWIHYEAYEMKFINNVIHNTAGAAFGTNGGYNILFAHNTAYSVGSRDHLLEFVFGTRSCDGDAEKVANCPAYNTAGGWGTSQTTTGSENPNPGNRDPQPIPNKNIFVFNNVIYNPASVVSGQHFAIYAPRNAAVSSNISSPANSDDNLVIKGNIIWNGSNSTPLGIEGGTNGCTDSNPTCNLSQLSAENSINTVEPQLISPAAGDLRPSEGSNILSAQTYTLVNFAGGDLPAAPVAPAGNLTNQVTTDRGGTTRTTSAPPGAYLSASSQIEPPPAGNSTPGDSTTPGGGTTGIAPVISNAKANCKKNGSKIACQYTAKASDADGSIVSVVAAASGKKIVAPSSPLKYKKGAYTGKQSIKGKVSKLSIKFTATDNSSNSATKSVRATVK